MEDSRQYLALVRHGLSAANVATGVPTDDLFYEIAGSDMSVGLVPLGEQQVTDAGLCLARFFPGNRRFRRMIASPFRRIEQSADGIERVLGYPIARSVDPRLVKRSYGIFWNLTYRGVEQLFPQEHELYCRQNYPDVFDRVGGFRNEVIEPSTDDLIIVTHSVVMLTLQRSFEGLSDDELLRRYEEQTLRNGQVLIYARDGAGQPWLPVP
jgi:broad specificity phosphatase PhoE